ncbi:GNAT family N-acetyltransferase [Cylindrospermum sp. FACHB-282]|uniref:GNAT family N-acetyltransferase n=1 Tax=Cylindrospermum sp. FACHB-282 TaxID=2692794 RepID=UPI0016848385|nr:GNAT family N-acetyltransferase [Cylindrospermum sp. FACHB-282]MBD2388436.1 GNAT family N-acetyltransferase [Cylindrospermum sp. FACHB-282]
MNYQIVDKLTENQILELVELYRNEFWSKKRTYQGVVKMLAASNIMIGLVDESEQLIGFTRILTDFVYRAIIYDVIIKPTYRKIGLGAKLLDAIINHPQLSKVEQVALFCLPEMVPFYERWGFTSAVGKLEFMYQYNQLPKEFENDC